MQAVPRTHSQPELCLQKMLRQRGLRFAPDCAPIASLNRKADMVFRRLKVAVFVDGCFWHGCPDHVTWPRNNSAWWRRKIQRNVERDRDTNRRLRAAGWTVIRIWEHQVSERSAERIRRRLDARRAAET